MKQVPRQRAPRVRYVAQDDGEGNWLISYADMMTLLLAFFVIISALSTPDAGKIERIRAETSKAMGVTYEDPYEGLENSIHNVLRDVKLDKEVQVKKTTDGIELVSKGTLFFDSGSSDLRSPAKELMLALADVVVREAKQFRVVVEGHTDDVPIVSFRYPSNWELSSSRAGTVVRMLETRGIQHRLLRPVGLADTEPVAPNRDEHGVPIPANQAKNRRIVIRIQKSAPERISK